MRLPDSFWKKAATWSLVALALLLCVLGAIQTTSSRSIFSYINKAEMSHVEPAVQDWPQLKGMDATEAKHFIQQHHKTLNVVLVPQGSAVTKDFRPDRVRIYYANDTKVVTDVPQTG
ncbi:hypothetical protein WJX74_006468 [Apatococcus lobatus]|uniref:Uncharacterized protein n=1 Tax=Apatococcus lobatus TaxID=904363 RepID=A0AAW1QBS7_9CHLO